MNSLQGKVALVTGSGQGVGRGIAEFFAEEGAVVITNNRKKKPNTAVPDYLTGEAREQFLAMSGDAETAAEAIRAKGGKAEAYFCDVSDYSAVKEMIDTIVKKYGRIDIVVNNAAITQAGGLMLLSESDWDRQTVVKLKGAFNTMRLAAPYMIKQGGGSFINVASDAWVGMVNAAAYSASNAGLVGLTRSCAAELFHYNINVNAICPQAASPGHVSGFTKTLLTLEKAMGEGFRMPEEKRKEVEADHGDARDLAPFLAFLVSDAGRDKTGGVFSVTASGRISWYAPEEELDGLPRSAPRTVEEIIELIPKSPLKDAFMCVGDTF